MAYKLTVKGKTRIIRDIREHTETVFYAWYRDHRLSVMEEKGSVYATCAAPDGGLIVDGYVHGDIWKKPTLADGIQMCMDNIFYEEASQ